MSGEVLDAEVIAEKDVVSLNAQMSRQHRLKAVIRLLTQYAKQIQIKK